MPYQLVRADDPLPSSITGPLVFLGGSCRGRDWRQDFYHRFESSDVTFINPRRDAFADPQLEPAAHAQQTEWDREMLDAADLTVFWLGEGLANQASRVEIGYAFGAQKPTVIGAEDNFLGGEHLTAFSGLVLSTSLDGLMNRFASLLTEYNARANDSAG